MVGTTYQGDSLDVGSVSGIWRTSLPNAKLFCSVMPHFRLLGGDADPQPRPPRPAPSRPAGPVSLGLASLAPSSRRAWLRPCPHTRVLYPHLPRSRGTGPLQVAAAAAPASRCRLVQTPFHGRHLTLPGRQTRGLTGPWGPQ